jgi:hypothetical protein
LNILAGSFWGFLIEGGLEEGIIFPLRFRLAKLII